MKAALRRAHREHRLATRIVAATPELAAVALALPLDGLGAAAGARRLPVFTFLRDRQQRRLLLGRALADQLEQRCAVLQLDAVRLGESRGVGGEGGTRDVGAALELVRRHDASELAHLLHADRLAQPVLALNDARRAHVLGLQPDVDATVRAVRLAARGQAGLGEEGFAEGFEAAPFDGGEDGGAPLLGGSWRWSGRSLMQRSDCSRLRVRGFERAPEWRLLGRTRCCSSAHDKVQGEQHNADRQGRPASRAHGGRQHGGHRAAHEQPSNHQKHHAQDDGGPSLAGELAADVFAAASSFVGERHVCSRKDNDLRRSDENGRKPLRGA